MNDSIMKLFFIICSGFMAAHGFEIGTQLNLPTEGMHDFRVREPNQIESLMLMNVGINPSSSEIHSNSKAFHKTMIR